MTLRTTMTKHPERLLLLAFIVIHGGMLAYDVTHPSVFVNADRASFRLEAIHGLQEAWTTGRVTSHLASHGNVGDYAPQAVIMALGGNAGLIVFQVVLALAAGLAVVRLGRILGWSNKLSAVACAIYWLLPHSLIYPHQLASEALHSPLLVISIWLGAEFVVRRRARFLLASALVLGLATLIRPITLLWPLVVALLLAYASRPKDGLKYVAAAMFPVIAWMSFMQVETGKFGMGESTHDMGHNLYNRVGRMAATLPPDEAARVRAEFRTQGNKGILGVGDYFRFASQYPAAFLRHAARDTMVFAGKSGIEQIAIDYLEIQQRSHDEVQEPRSGWRRRWEAEGILATLRYLKQMQVHTLVMSAAGSLAVILLVGSATVGAWHLLSNLSKLTMVQRFTAVLLVSLPLYILLFTQVVAAMQSRHRAPAEAALVLLAVIGVKESLRRLSQPFRSKLGLNAVRSESGHVEAPHT